MVHLVKRGQTESGKSGETITEDRVSKEGTVKDTKTTTTFDNFLMNSNQIIEGNTNVVAHEFFHVEQEDEHPQAEFENRKNEDFQNTEELGAQDFGDEVMQEPDTLTDKQAQDAVQNALDNDYVPCTPANCTGVPPDKK
jgi:hypothetical protein